MISRLNPDLSDALKYCWCPLANSLIPRPVQLSQTFNSSSKSHLSSSLLPLASDLACVNQFDHGDHLTVQTYIKMLNCIQRIFIFQFSIYKVNKKTTSNFLPFLSTHPHISFTKLYLQAHLSFPSWLLSQQDKWTVSCPNLTLHPFSLLALGSDTHERNPSSAIKLATHGHGHQLAGICGTAENHASTQNDHAYKIAI